MGFTVEPHALDDCAGLIGRAGDDASATKSYLGGYTITKGWNGGLIALVGPGAADAVEASIDAVRKASAILYVSQGGLTSAAKYYRQTDADAASRIDATLPGREPAFATSEEGAWAATGITPTFNDVREPGDRLTPVDEVEYSHPLGFLDAISPAQLVLEVWEYVFGHNPLNEILDFIVGDWEGFAKAGKALANAADALEDLALNVQGGAVALHPAWWQGHAGETAYQFFARTAQGVVDDLVRPMREIADHLAKISEGVWNFCEAVSGVIKGMIDSAIIVGVAAVGSFLTAESGIGPLLGAGVAAIQIARLYTLYGTGTELVTSAYNVAQGLLGLIEAGIFTLRGASLQEPAGGGYTHPLADH